MKRSDSKSGAKKDRSAGDIFKSFAKAKAKPKESPPAHVEDGVFLCRYSSDLRLTLTEPMQGMSEDEGDADDEPEVAFNDEAAEAAKKARKERADKLRKMMEEPGELNLMSFWGD
jgi:DNA polymerase delta subunit 3